MTLYHPQESSRVTHTSSTESSWRVGNVVGGFGMVSRFNEIVADRIAHDSGRGVKTELAQDGRSVRLDGLNAYVEKVRDCFVPVSFRDELDDTALPVC